jgi:subtilisin family serine protease
VVKPDILAPGRYLISALAQNSIMGTKEANPGHILGGGKYLAWEGTSAATPYVAGVVALMLQKNPQLDAEAVHAILIRTARHDQFTGAVPNPLWGYGKLDPAAALKQVPEPASKP